RPAVERRQQVGDKVIAARREEQVDDRAIAEPHLSERLDLAEHRGRQPLDPVDDDERIAAVRGLVAQEHFEDAPGLGRARLDGARPEVVQQLLQQLVAALEARPYPADVRAGRPLPAPAAERGLADAGDPAQEQRLDPRLEQVLQLLLGETDRVRYDERPRAPRCERVRLELVVIYQQSGPTRCRYGAAVPLACARNPLGLSTNRRTVLVQLVRTRLVKLLKDRSYPAVIAGKSCLEVVRTTRRESGRGDWI